jgi:hypothetical protein
METKYDAIAARSSSPISEDPEEVTAVLAAQPELWRFREAPVQEEVLKFMNGSLDRFTTGGFAVKAVPAVEDLNPGLLLKAAKIVEQIESADEVPGMGLDPDVEVETPAKKAKKFSNLDDVREMLSK